MRVLWLALCLTLAALPTAAQVAAPAASSEDGGNETPVPVISKNARVAMGASALFPGLGQLYNEEGLKTLVVFVWESYYIATILRAGLQADCYRRRAAALDPGETWQGLDYDALRARFHEHEDRQTDYIWYSSALFLASILDAYVFAHLYSFETDDVRERRAGVLPLIDPSKRAVGLQLRWRF